ncbi:MAG: MATE family efflux transporter, partial [Ruminococcus sp.]
RDAVTPVTAYSFGSGNRKRIFECIKFGHIYTAVIMLAGFAAIEIFAVPFSDIFGLSGETQKLCVSAMRIISVSFVFAGANITFQGLFQAMDGGIQSLIISICRQVLFVFPFALIFRSITVYGGSMEFLSWTTFPIAEILTFIIAWLMFKRTLRNGIFTNFK